MDTPDRVGEEHDLALACLMSWSGYLQRPYTLAQLRPVL